MPDFVPDEEEWRPVLGNHFYEVSNQGRVRSLRRDAPRVLKPWLLRTGYFQVEIGRGFDFRLRAGRIAVHILVCEAFHGPRPSKNHLVRHLNGIPSDNRPENLSWGTMSENIFDAIAHGTHTNANKTHCPQGHAYTPENTYLSPEGHRKCATCVKRRSKARYDRRRGEQVA